jgi:tRNA(Arg) A34 adenosine deaminase TadA
MKPRHLQHQPHPTDTARTMGGRWRTACGRWAGIRGFAILTGSEPCPQCAVAILIHDTSAPSRPEAP